MQKLNMGAEAVVCLFYGQVEQFICVLSQLVWKNTFDMPGVVLSAGDTAGYQTYKVLAPTEHALKYENKIKW